MQIFVSYSSLNRDAVKILVKDLEDAGYDLWFDQELLGGDEWWELILENIKRCDLFLLALTLEWLNSNPCQREYTYATALNKRILPVKLGDIGSISLIPVEIQKFNFVDFHIRNTETLKKLIKSINVQTSAMPLPNPLPEPPSIPLSPLTEVSEQLAADELTEELQASLLIRLGLFMERSSDRMIIFELLTQFRKHPNLQARTEREIDRLLAIILETAPQQNPPSNLGPSSHEFESALLSAALATTGSGNIRNHLEVLFDFTGTELELNRSGLMSIRQLKPIQQEAKRLFFGGLMALFPPIVFLLILFRPFPGRECVLLCGFYFYAIFVYLVLRNAWVFLGHSNQKRAAGKIRVLVGTLSATKMGNKQPQTLVGNQYVSVSDYYWEKKFGMLPGTYRAYVTKVKSQSNLPTLLSIEPYEESNPTSSYSTIESDEKRKDGSEPKQASQ